MLIIVDHRSPSKSIEKLKKHGDIHLFNGYSQTYNAVSSHPDIFMFQSNNELIIAPNCPRETVNELKKYNIKFSFGNKPVGHDLENSTQYNCLESESYFIHTLSLTDTAIKPPITKKQINVPQAYTRCSCIALDKNIFITSDMGIHKTVCACAIESYYFEPQGIILPPYKNGFLGGCCGIHNNNFYVLGNLDFIKKGNELRQILKKNNYNVIELYEGPLYDGGGIFFLNKNK